MGEIELHLARTRSFGAAARDAGNPGGSVSAGVPVVRWSSDCRNSSATTPVDPPGAALLLPGSLAATDRPTTVKYWLDYSPAPHDPAGELAPGGPSATTVSMSCPPAPGRAPARGAGQQRGLPARDEQMPIRLERWITAASLAERSGPRRGQLLYRATRSGTCCAGSAGESVTRDTTYGQAVSIRRHVTAATTLLDWLTARTPHSGHRHPK
ncbi:hypothetical protein HBB16_19400 [Pseudonocardia sp. MCCB 268]|nr:hypothetical protein [Pseudonocardia cytotoxica]